MGFELKAYLGENYQVINEVAQHQWKSDEPEDLGGKNTGPTPVELLLSALASCKMITMRMYAERKQWETGRIDIHLTIEQLAEKTVIHKEITFAGALSDEQRIRLLEISNRCPVAKMITHPIEFKLN
jgi:putative redox protein